MNAMKMKWLTRMAAWDLEPEDVTPLAESGFQPYLSPLPARGFRGLGLEQEIKFLVPDEGVQRWLDQRWAGVASEVTFLAQNFVMPGQVVVECGAGYGLRAMALAALVGPRGRVVAFEAEPRRHLLLTENVLLNGLTNLTVDATTVGMMKLDAYLHDRQIDPDVLILDVNGREREILKGAVRTLRRGPRLWIVADPNCPRADRASLVEVGEELACAYYDWSILSRNRTPSTLSEATATNVGPTYLLGIPRSVRGVVTTGQTVGTVPTIGPLESYSR